MGEHRYKSSRNPLIPQTPRINFQIVPPDLTYAQAISTPLKFECVDAVIDTGSDFTLIPLSWVHNLSRRVAGRAYSLGGVGGGLITVIPYLVGIIFDDIYFSDFRIKACPIEQLGDEVLIGRDLLNQLKLELNGPALTFTVYPLEDSLNFSAGN